MSVDLARVDAELDQLGSVPEGLAELVARYAPPDLSLAHVDEVLDALSAGAEIPTVAALPVAAEEPMDLGPVGTVGPGSGRVSIRDTVVDRPAPIADRTAADAAELAEAFAESMLPPVGAAGPDVGEAADSPLPPDGFAMAELDEEGSSSFSAEELARLDVQDVSEMLQRGSEHPEPEPEPDARQLESEPGQEPESERSEPPAVPPAMSALLDQDLDPGDFPQTPSAPPPPPSGRPASTPPEPAVAAAGADEDIDDFEEADDADFELMVDDEDIIEIEADDFEILDDDED